MIKRYRIENLSTIPIPLYHARCDELEGNKKKSQKKKTLFITQDDRHTGNTTVPDDIESGKNLSTYHRVRQYGHL